MLRALCVSAVLACLLALAASVPAAASRPTYLVCDLGEEFGEWLVVVDNFGGMRGAVRHCIDDLNGHPAGVM